ncbi:MAG: hypothetical protein C0448_04575 [Sphingobacteriaceae bacterium]|nr:hypothetical protein [Sphingobacteriaceae bacterium]
MKIFTLIFFYLLSITINGQTSNSNPFENPIILNHYSVQDLQSLQQTDTAKFNSIVYFYTSSYIFEETECNNCIPVSAINFDVSEYEYLRQKTSRYTREFKKYGFKLTLLSINELTYKLPIHYTK